jgi:hypothetical protein
MAASVAPSIAATSPKHYPPPLSSNTFGLNEALELCLFLRDKEPTRFLRAALRWLGRFCREVNVSLEEAQAVLAALVLMPGERKVNTAYALAELLSRGDGTSLRDTCRLARSA